MWHTITQATVVLKVSRRTIYNWIFKGKIKYKKNLAESKQLVWIPDDYNDSPKES